jgi:hypothetical protein
MVTKIHTNVPYVTKNVPNVHFYQLIVPNVKIILTFMQINAPKRVLRVILCKFSRIYVKNVAKIAKNVLKIQLNVPIVKMVHIY